MRRSAQQHELRTYIRDEMTTFDMFPATVQELKEGGKPTEKIEPEDDQDEDSEQSLSDSLQLRGQIARVHENISIKPHIGPRSTPWRSQTPRGRFVLAAAKHSCGACEAQKRPAGPIVSRSPNSFVFNDVVGLDLFFLNTYEKHTPYLP